MPDRIERLVNRALPRTWREDLAREIGSAWCKAVRRHAAPARIRALGDRLVAELQASFGDPEPLRARLRAYARRTAGDDRQLRRALDAEAERMLGRFAKRATKLTLIETEALIREHALAKDAQRNHREVMDYNWDDGVEGMRQVIESEACALGTALLVYWLARPHYYRQNRTRREAGAWERGTWDLIRRIEAKLERGRFLHLGIAFDPRALRPGDDWTKDIYADLPRRAQLPAHVWIRTTVAGVEPIRRR